jgi:hypothetical protein
MSSQEAHHQNASSQFDRFLQTLEKLGREDLVKNLDIGLDGIVLLRADDPDYKPETRTPEHPQQ